MFCCRELLFSKLFYRHQQQQPPPPVLRAAAGNRISRQSLDKCCFSRFPDDTLGSFFAWFWTLLVLPSHGVLLPGAAFFEAVLPASAAAAAATSSASSRKQQNLSTLLVRPSEPWCFAAGGCFFRSCFTGISSSSRRQQNLSTNAVFLDFSRFPDDTLGSFFRVVLDLARPSEPWCFAAGSCFFRSCFTGISSSSRRHQFCEQPQVTESFDLARPSEPWCFAAGGCFFRSCFYRHQQQQPSPPVLRAAASDRIFFKAMVFYCREMLCSKLFSREQLQATESLDKCFFSRISDDMLGSFFACFWTLLVLQSHGVLLPGATFFEAVLPASAAAAAATSSASSRRQQNLSTISRQCAVFLGFQTTR